MIKHFRIKNNFLLSGLFFLVTLFSVGSSLVSCSDSEKIVTQTEEKIVYVDGNWMVVASKEVNIGGSRRIMDGDWDMQPK